MGNESRYDQYDLNITLPEPLVPRICASRCRSGWTTGPRAAALDEARCARWSQIEARAGQQYRSRLLHASSNGAHEQLVADNSGEELPDIPVSLSSEVSPEMREWERFSTTVANAYVQPMMARYLRQLEAGSARPA
jgi:N-methylhydantoinase A